MRLHHSRHVRPVILRQQGGGGRNIRLVDMLGILKERGGCQRRHHATAGGADEEREVDGVGGGRSMQARS